MTNLEAFLNPPPETIEFPEDVALLKSTISTIRPLSDAQVQRLYRDWCELYYCAGWMVMYDCILKEFEGWLNQEVDSTSGWWDT
jgi:hypothetical protein